MLPCERNAVRVGLFLLLVLGLGAGTAHAHKVKVFAAVEGKSIVGYVYFPGGGRAKGVPVVFSDAAGKKLGETTTDANGEFRFQATTRCDHQIAVDTGDGHRATATVAAADLPGDLPAGEGGPKVASDPAKAATQPVPPVAESESKPAAPDAAELERRIAEAVQRHVRPLQEQIERAEEKRRLQDILGGIGYILGLAGITFYFLGVARRKREGGRP